jgi:hypothetical protein
MFLDTPVLAKDAPPDVTFRVGALPFAFAPYAAVTPEVLFNLHHPGGNLGAN